MRGTIVCGVTDRDDEGHAAIELGVEPPSDAGRPKAAVATAAR